MTHILDIKLIRTDTTLDLSQNAQKGMLSFVSSSPFYVSALLTLLSLLLSMELIWPPLWSHHKLFCKISGLNLTFCLVIYYLTMAGLYVRHDILDAREYNSDYHQLLPWKHYLILLDWSTKVLLCFCYDFLIFFQNVFSCLCFDWKTRKGHSKGMLPRTRLIVCYEVK